MRQSAALSIFSKLAKKQQDMITFCNFTRDKLLTMRKEFDGFDTDNSGAIDVKELETALRTLGEFQSQEQLDEIMAEADLVRAVPLAYACDVDHVQYLWHLCVIDVDHWSTFEFDLGKVHLAIDEV